MLLALRVYALWVRAARVQIASQFVEHGAPERIRTSDPQIRNLVLYPTELPGRRYFSIAYCYLFSKNTKRATNTQHLKNHLTLVRLPMAALRRQASPPNWQQTRIVFDRGCCPQGVRLCLPFR